MPRTPGILPSPNSAPDSFTPKYVNLVRVPGQTEEDGAEMVVDAVVGWTVVVGVVVVARVLVSAPGWHWK